MRKLLSVLFSTLQGGVRGGLLFVALLATTALWAQRFQVGDLYYNITSSSEPYTVEVTNNGTYTLTSVVIPASVEYNGITYAVTSIGAQAFYACTSLTSISIPNSVTTIGYLAFTGCSSLTSITIPKSVTDMGKLQTGGPYRGPVFTYCPALTSIVVEEGNPIYDSRDNCNAIVETATNTIICGCKNTTFSQSVTGIGTYAFNGCSSLTSITIPNQVTNIQSNPFLSCSSFATIVVESNNSIYDSRDNCNAIIETATNTLIAGCQNTTIPNNVTSIGESAFYGCSSLTSINIPENITSIGGSAFRSCSSLISINIPEGVTSIEPSTFWYCSSLTSVSIPESVTSIGDYAFQDCDSLTSITIQKNVTSIGNQVFSSSLDTIYCYIVTPIQISASTFSNYRKAILFVPCESLDAYFADKVWKRFDNIQCLGDEIPQEGNSIYYTSSDGNIVTPNAYFSATDVFGANIISNTYENGQGIITFDGAVTSIGDNAFLNCSSLTSITIPNSITSIGVHAFDDCESLISINIPNSITSIGEMAFAWCSSLTSIEIPNSLISIENGTFVNCSSLTSITIPNSVTNIGESAFRYCSSLTSITIPENVTSIGKQAFAESSSLDTIYCYIKTPLEITADIFSQYNATLYVPCESLEVYKAHEVWGQFENIKCIEDVETDAENIHTQSPMTNCQKIIQDNQLLILRDDKTYNIVGQIVE